MSHQFPEKPLDPPEHEFIEPPQYLIDENKETARTEALEDDDFMREMFNKTESSNLCMSDDIIKKYLEPLTDDTLNFSCRQISIMNRIVLSELKGMYERHIKNIEAKALKAAGIDREYRGTGYE